MICDPATAADWPTPSTPNPPHPPHPPPPPRCRHCRRSNDAADAACVRERVRGVAAAEEDDEDEDVCVPVPRSQVNHSRSHPSIVDAGQAVNQFRLQPLAALSSAASSSRRRCVDRRDWRRRWRPACAASGGAGSVAVAAGRERAADCRHD